VRSIATALGLGAIVFGIPAVIAPAPFARLFGIASAADPTVATAIRSVGIRDVMIGLGLFRAARGGDGAALRQWLIARAASDAGDACAVGLAVAAGVRDPRFLGLGGLAAGAAALGMVLLRAVPSSSSTRPRRRA
jgi:hypothetical protein